MPTGVITNHNLADRTITYELLNERATVHKRIVTDREGNPISAKVLAPDAHGAGAEITFAPPDYRVDLFNFRAAAPKIHRAKLDALIRKYPDRLINWPKVAGDLGFDVRASWNWPSNIRRGYDCEMEVHHRRLGDVSHYLHTLEDGWQERHSWMTGRH